jgi:RHH-type rel operon transcriptional repressor/antitoxin RelB
MAAIEIPDELASQIEHAAQRAGQSNTAFLREAVLSRLEDLEDIAIATERINNPGERISLEQLKKDLGIED